VGREYKQPSLFVFLLFFPCFSLFFAFAFIIYIFQTMNDLARYPQSNARDSGVYPRPIHPPPQQPQLQQSAPVPSPLAPPHRPLEPTPPSQIRYPSTTQAGRTSQSTPMNNANNNPASYDLQEIIVQYQQQPELLKLILSSKVEEDKRRAEEAKLRAKEIDLLLQQQSTSSNEMDVEEVSVKGRSSSDYSYAHPRAVPIRARMQSNDSIGPVRRGSILNSLDERRSSFASQSSR
jgi:hypothetical protein